MVELSERWRAILHAVHSGPLAWRTPREVAASLGWDYEQTCDELASLDVRGWLEVWEQDESPVVTLSALAAEILAVRLVEYGPEGRTRWIGRGDPEPPAQRARAVGHDQKGVDWERLLDPHPTPEQLCEWWDDIATPRPGDVDTPVPRPSLLIGTGLTPWPGPAADGEKPCPACGSIPVAPHAYCIRCDAWGRDASPSSKTSGQVRPSSGRSRNPDRRRERDAQQESERAKRKRKRRNRLAARLGSLPDSAIPPRRAPHAGATPLTASLSA